MSFVYDRQTLLNIRMAIDSTKGDVEEYCRFPPPAQLRWYPADLPWRRRRRRSRGKRGGIAARLKSLARSSPMSVGPALTCERCSAGAFA